MHKTEAYDLNELYPTEDDHKQGYRYAGSIQVPVLDSNAANPAASPSIRTMAWSAAGIVFAAYGMFAVGISVALFPPVLTAALAVIGVCVWFIVFRWLSR